MPSCSKCAKAGVTCIDIDARRAGVSIPRAFLPDVQARLEWLENLVKTRLPDVDLNAGPQVPENPDQGARSNSRLPPEDIPAQVEGSVGRSARAKRTSHCAGFDEVSSIPKGARRMAADLGLFSLNASATHPQYLGSSSGSFFADLLADADAECVSDPDTDGHQDVQEDPRSVPFGARSLLKSLKHLLPPREECDRMVKGYFSFYHADYPVLHQPSFLKLVDALYISSEAPEDCQLQYNGWPASVEPFGYNDEKARTDGRGGKIAIHLATGITHLFFVLSIAAELQSRKRRFAVDPRSFTTQAIACLQKSVAEVSLASAQSMVLYVLHSFLSADGARTWVILHVAMSYAIDMGLQRTPPESVNLSRAVVQMRRRVFFTIYTLDR